MSKLILTPEQEELIIKCWNNSTDNKTNPPTLLEMTQAAFPEIQDIRCPQGMAVKMFVGKRNMTFSKSRAEKLPDIELSDEDKAQISELLEEGRNSLEIAKIIFNDPELKALNKETQTVSKYINSLPAVVKEKTIDKGYRPPKSIIEGIARVNKAILDGVKKEDSDKEYVKRAINGLIKFLHSKRFITDYESFSDPKDKELYEDSFIKYVWDKPDLTQEDLDSYCNLCTKIISLSQLNKEERRLSELIDANLEEKDGKSINMSLYEHIDKVRERRDKNIEEQEKLKKSLSGSRAERNKGKNEKKSTFADSIQFVIDEEKRKRFLAIEMKYREALRNETDKLESMDDLKFEIHGISKEEVIYG